MYACGENTQDAFLKYSLFFIFLVVAILINPRHLSPLPADADDAVAARNEADAAACVTSHAPLCAARRTLGRGSTEKTSSA